uniref:Uncharacterized protein n=1 Tax=Kalanchoe fedtschenkoi TaxID=63787 RepID=A0A7N0VLP2_KALFE
MRDQPHHDAGSSSIFSDSDDIPRHQALGPTYSDPNLAASMVSGDGDCGMRKSSASFGPNSFNYEQPRISTEGSPMRMSPWNQTSPFGKSEWSQSEDGDSSVPRTGLIGSLTREEGHIYSLAARGDVLYTGSDSKNIRVWKDLKELAAFKSNSGLVKAIVISGDKIFSGHQDGKIRVWKVSQNVHKRYGTLPTLKDILKCSIKPSNYVQVRKNRSALWIKHSDAISCLSLNEPHGLLYSASWDRTFKVWRISDSKCLESVNAHDDAVNSVVASLDTIVLTGSADGTVKLWKREVQGKVVKHVQDQTLLKLECAVTALAVNPAAATMYSGSSDGLVNFWDRQKQLAHGGVLKGHKLAVLCLETAGNLVISGSADKTICIWRRDGMMHTCLSVLTGHTGPVKCFAVEQDAESSKANDQRWKLYSGSLDKSVKVWSVSDQVVDMGAVTRMMSGSEGQQAAWDSAASVSSFSSQG